MDQKHAMLYPDTSSMPVDQRSSAAAAIGLPIEAPPSYDVATRDPITTTTATTTPMGWTPSAPDIHYPSGTQYSPQMNRHHLPVIVEQANFPLPTNQQSTTTHGRQNQPQHQHQQQQQQQQHQIDGVPITVQPTGTLSSKLGPNPSTVTCPACGACKTTRMSYTPNSRTHLCGLILCLVGWCCCACIVPYCMNSCRTGNHYCAKCNAFLGAYNPRPRSHRR